MATEAKVILTAEDRTKAAFTAASQGLGEISQKASLAAGTLAGLGSAVTIAGMVSLAKTVLNSVDAFNDLKDATGASIENISALDDIARRNGSSFETVSNTLLKFNQALVQTQKPGSEAEKVLKALGLNVKQLRDMDPAEAFRVTAIAMNQFTADGNLARASQELFGRSLREVAPLLKDVADAGQLNAKITTQQAEEAERFNKQLSAMTAEVEDLKREVAMGLVPAMNLLLQNFRDIKNLGAMDLILKDAAKDLFSFGMATKRITGDNGGDINRIIAERVQLEKQLMSAQADGRGMHVKTLNEEIFTLNRYLELLRTKQRNEVLATMPGDVGDAMSRRMAPQQKLKREDESDAAAARALKKELEEQAKLLAELSGLSGSFAEDWNRLNVIFAKGALSLEQLTKAQADLLAKQPIAKKQLDEAKDAREKQIKVDKAWNDAFTQSQEEAAAGYVAESKAREQARLAVDAYAKGIGDTQDLLLLEKSLLGATQEVRARAIALYRVELELKQQLAAIDGSAGFDEAQREEQRAKARAAAAQARANVELQAEIDVADKALKEWQDTNKQIGASFVDNLMRGGKSVARYLKDLFRTLVLQPMLAPVGQAMGGMIGSLPAGAGGGSGLLGMAGNFTGLNGGTLGSIGSAFMGGYSGIAGLGAATVATPMMGGMAAAGTMLATDAMGATVLSGAAGATGAGGLAAGASAAMAAIPVAGWIALAALAIASMAGGGETRVGGQYSGTRLIDSPSGGPINNEATSGAIGATLGSINSMLAALGSTAGVNVFQSGLEQSEKGKGFAYARGTLSTGQQFGNWADEGYMQNRGSMTAEEAAAKFGEELKQATLGALQAADVPGILGDYLRELGDVEALSGGALDAALARINKALTEKQTLEEQLYVLTHTELEVLNRNRQRERDALDESNRALYDQVLALQDQKIAAAAAASAIESLQSATATIESALRDVGTEVQRFADVAARSMADLGDARNNISLALFAAEDAQTAAQRRVNDIIRERIRSIDDFLGELTGSRTESLSTLKARLSATSVLAAGGDSQAQARLIAQAQAVLKAAEASSTSRADFVRQEAFVRQQLLMVRGAGVDYLQGAPGGADEPMGQLEAALADLQTATQRTADLMALAAETGASTDRSMRDAAGSILGLSAAYHQALHASTLAQADYSIAIAATAGLQLSTAGTFDALNASLADLDAASDAAALTLAGSAGLLGAEFDSLRAKLSALLAGIGGQSAATAPPAAIDDATIRDYIASAAPGGGTEAEVRQIYLAAIQNGVSSARIDAAMRYAPGTALGIARSYGLPAFADGGSHSGGWAMVGERGPELAYMPPARIYSAEQSRTLAGSSNAELLAELRALRAEVAALRRPAEEAARHAEASSVTLTRVTRGGKAMQTEAFA